jgi:hypothetical protein
MAAKRRWYARYRSRRFARRFGGLKGDASTIHLAIVLQGPAPPADDTSTEDRHSQSTHHLGNSNRPQPHVPRRQREKLSVA